MILLPVLGLAVAGVVALSRDQAAVEAEARRSAEAVASEVAARVSRSLPSELSMVELAGNMWFGDGVIGRHLPNGPHGGDAAPDDRNPGRRVLAEVLNRYPLPAWEFLPVILRFDAVGVLEDPPPLPEVPQPPPWVTRLPADAARTADRDALATRLNDPGFSALVRTEQQLSALGADAGTPAERLQRLLAIGQRAVEEQLVTDSGTPLAVSVFARGLAWDPQASLDPAWFSLVQGLVLTQPSFFSPWVLEQALEMGTRSPSPPAGCSVSEVSDRWWSDQRRRDLAARLGRRLTRTTTTLTNLWIEQASGASLVVVHPPLPLRETAAPATPVARTNAACVARSFPERVLAAALERAVSVVGIVEGRDQRIQPSLRSGLTLAFEVEGRPVAGIPAPWAGVWDPSQPVLAAASGEFLQDGLLDQERFDNWPTRPRFTVRVVLSDAAALYASQRRQQWLFGGMILATAGVAGIGIWQADRAFRRQCALAEQKSNFVSSVSHELRAPLASMRLLAEGLAGGRVQDDAKRREYAGFLLEETRRLGGLVDNILDFARMEQGRQQYEFEPLDAVRWLRETVRLMEPLAAERGVILVGTPAGTEPASEGWTATWDARAMQQVLINLIDNALKHSPSGSRVLVTLERTPTLPIRFHLRVQDQGTGIPSEDHERIFDRFHRRGSELRRETQGIGLGLSIVRYIVEAHGGRVWVESEPGQGAVFHVAMAERPPGRGPWPGS